MPDVPVNVFQGISGIFFQGMRQNLSDRQLSPPSSF